MKRPALLVVLIALAAVPLQARAGAAGVDEGRDQFRRHCAACHFAGGTGAFMLKRRLGEAKMLLDARSDLSPDYVRYVVRHGLQSMPWFSKVDVTDAGLDAIAAYLARDAAPAGARP